MVSLIGCGRLSDFPDLDVHCYAKGHQLRRSNLAVAGPLRRACVLSDPCCFLGVLGQVELSVIQCQQKELVWAQHAHLSNATKYLLIYEGDILWPVFFTFQSFPGGSDIKNLLKMQENPGQSLDWEDPFFEKQNSLLSAQKSLESSRRVLGAFMTPCPLDVSLLIQHHGSSIKGKENNSSHGNELKPPLRSINHDTHWKQADLGLQPHHSVWRLLETTCGFHVQGMPTALQLNYRPSAWQQPCLFCP